MKEINKELIEYGRGLKRLRDEDADFAVVLKEIKDRIKTNQDMVLAFKSNSVSTDVTVPYYLYRYQALQELLEWIDDEIDSGEDELRKQIDLEKKVLGV